MRLRYFFYKRLILNEIKLDKIFYISLFFRIFASSNNNKQKNNMAEYKVMYKSGDEFKELSYRFDRFRKAFQFINNDSSKGYTEYFVALALARDSNRTRFSTLRHPSVIVKIQGRKECRYYKIVDVNAEMLYDNIRNIQESEEAEE